MTKRLARLTLSLLFCIAYRTVARAQSVVLTWEDDATFQLYQNPDGSFPVPQPPPEPVSGSLGAKFGWYTADWNGNGPASEWYATDLRLQSRSWAVTLNPQACGGRLLRGTLTNDGVGVDVNIATFFGNAKNVVSNEFIGANLVAECNGWDIALVTFQGTTGTGIIDFINGGASFTGPTINDPVEVPNAEGWIVFGNLDPSGGGPLGRAVIRGTMRVEISDGTATVVKLRQGIPAGPSPHQTLQDWNPPWEDIQYDSAMDPLNPDGELENRIYNYGCKLTSLYAAEFSRSTDVACGRHQHFPDK